MRFMIILKSDAASESGEVRLNEPRIKALTGSDPITARYLYGEPFTFTPAATFATVLALAALGAAITFAVILIV